MDFEDELTGQVASVISDALVSAAEEYGFPHDVAMDIGTGFQRVIEKRRCTSDEASAAATQVHGLLGRTSVIDVARNVDGWEAFIETILDTDPEHVPQFSMDFQIVDQEKVEKAPVGFCLDCSNLIWPSDLDGCSKCSLKEERGAFTSVKGGFGIRCQRCKHLISDMDDSFCPECEQAWDSPS